VVDARFVRLNVIRPSFSGERVARIYEFEVYGPGGRLNLALGRPATGSLPCSPDQGPEKAVNGSVAGGEPDRWCAEDWPLFLQVDLGTEYRRITYFDGRREARLMLVARLAIFFGCLGMFMLLPAVAVPRPGADGRRCADADPAAGGARRARLASRGDSRTATADRVGPVDRQPRRPAHGDLVRRGDVISLSQADATGETIGNPLVG
jgi:hypothetical protein